MKLDPKVIAWLLEGDPSIRWQVQCDLLKRPKTEYEKERKRVASTGWGARLLKLQAPDGYWGGGIYSPKWISTTYTMLTLRLLGLGPADPQARMACRRFLERGFYTDGGINFFTPSFKYSETCVTGMILALLAYFRFPDDRIHTVVKHLIGQQMPDGGWNCESYKGATHASFHTTISALEGLHEYEVAYPGQVPTLKKAVRRGHEFLLRHHLFRSHRTGMVFDPAMTRIPFPPRWRYDFLRALDYFQMRNADRDERMADAIDLLLKKQGQDGRWLMNRGMTGRTFFELEHAGQPSRWNTLRSLRVLSWWNG
jgi:hypothetical protein